MATSNIWSEGYWRNVSFVQGLLCAAEVITIFIFSCPKTGQFKSWVASGVCKIFNYIPSLKCTMCNGNVQCAMEMCNIKKQFSILFSILHPIPSQWVKPSPLNLFNCSRPPKPNLFSPPLQEFNFSDMYQGGGGVPLTEHWAALLQNIRFGQVEEPMTSLARRLLFWWSSNETLWGVRDLTGLKSCENKWHGIVLVMYFDVHVQ